MTSKKSFRSIALIVLLSSLTACMSLAEDITPPPGYQAPTVEQSTPTSESPVYPMLPPDPARGASLYAEKCAPCHGTTGLGDGSDAGMLSNPVAPLGDPALARVSAPDDWYLMVTNGNMQNFMPPFASLTVPERWDVIAYAYTLSTTPEEVEWGQELYNENCATCHGEHGKGDGPEAGSLTTSPINFTDQEFMGARSATDLFDSITNGLGEMHSFANLSEGDRWALTAYLRTLTFAEPTLEGEVTETPQAYPYPPPEESPEIPVETPSEDQAEPETGTVSVEVVPASDVMLPSGLEVTVYSFEGTGMTQVYSKTLSYPGENNAIFDDVPIPLEQIIFATTEHDGIVYISDISVVEQGMSSFDLTIPYYEQTTDLSVLQAERLHVFYGFESSESIQVYVLYIFSNTTDQVLTSENQGEPALTFTLPEDAFNLQRDSGMEFQDVDTADGFGILNVYPSSEPYQIWYSFDLPYEKEKVSFDLPIGMDATALIVMAPENGVKVESDQLTDAGMRDIEGTSYSIYNGSSMQAGDLLNMTVSGWPKASPGTNETGSSDTSTGLVIGLAAFGVTLIAAGVYLWQRNRSERTDWDEAQNVLEDDLTLESSEDLMDAIIALDELYKDGEIPEDAYHKRRAELKERLQEQLD